MKDILSLNTFLHDTKHILQILFTWYKNIYYFRVELCYWNSLRREIVGLFLFLMLTLILILSD